MSFDDTTARPGVVWRYRIRRESLDARYRFESATSSGWFPDTARDLGLRITTPARGSLTFTVSGAGGTLVSQLHDLQGRLAMKQLHPTNSTGEDSYSLDIGRLGSVRQGVYFLRVLDSTGRASPPRKVVILP